jgi:hypothetical protein
MQLIGHDSPFANAIGSNGPQEDGGCANGLSGLADTNRRSATAVD